MIVAFTRLHYGADYLGSVIASAIPFVDKFIILYTPVATFGRIPQMPCPESRAVLYDIATACAGDKLDWRDDLPISAATAIGLYPDTEIALELDADEVIHPALFECIITDYKAGTLDGYCYRLPFYHHWRSFRYVCDDSSWPARLYLPHHENRPAQFYADAPARVHHFGYARREHDMRYKWEASAHNPDFRANWWGDIWEKFPERLTDLHPVSVDFWNAQDFDLAGLPPVLQGHPYRDMAVIE
jgi:hypothetical protein